MLNKYDIMDYLALVELVMVTTANEVLAMMNVTNQKK
jgi:hypothetical protein